MSPTISDTFTAQLQQMRTDVLAQLRAQRGGKIGRAEAAAEAREHQSDDWAQADAERMAKRGTMLFELVNSVDHGIQSVRLERDSRDMGRADAPLCAAPDAVVIDTSEMSIDEAVGQAIALVQQRLAAEGHHR